MNSKCKAEMVHLEEVDGGILRLWGLSIRIKDYVPYAI
jgi:hypothetical protein